MATKVQDILKVSIVFIGEELLKTPDQYTAFSDAIDTEVTIEFPNVATGQFQGNLGSVRKIELPKERITLELSENTTVVNIEYPQYESLSRLIEITGHAINNTELDSSSSITLRYIIDLVYDQSSGESALQYVGKRLFGDFKIEIDEWSLGGGIGTLDFNSKEGRWYLQLEPRFRDENATKVFMSLNLIKHNQQIPSNGTIKPSLDTVWGNAHEIIPIIDGRTP